MTTPHPSAFNPYLRHGWCLVPIQAGTKGPNTPQWNTRAACITESSDIPEGMGGGLAHAFSGTAAIDLDNLFMAEVLFAERGIDLQALLDAPDAVQVISGRMGSGKLLYRLSAPLPSKKLNINGQTIVEFRCSTADGLTVQDLLPPSRHPSGSTYQWGGKGDWQALPILPAAILAWWQELLEVKHVSNGPTTLENLDEVRDALQHIPASVGHDTWLEVLMALHSTGHHNAFEVARQWSMTCEAKYPGDREFAIRWNSFKGDRGITISSLYHHARQHGWVRSPIDVMSLFNGPPQETINLLAGMVVQPPAIPMDLFPTVLRDYAMEVSNAVGCDPSVPTMAGLAAVCAAIDSRCRLELVHGFKVPPVLWLMTIGSPADKKSPGSKPLFTVLADIERDDAARYRQDVARWEAEEAMFASTKKSFLSQAGDSELMMATGGDILSGLPDLPILRPQPVPKRLVISDATSQKMVRLAAERPEGLLCYLDEANGWLHKMGSATSGDDRSSWVSSYESDPYHMDRVGAGSIRAENLAVSVYCNVQPKVFRQVIPLLSTDGLLQRFIPITLRPSMTRLGHPIPAWSSLKPTWDHAIRLVHALGERHYTLSESAYSEFRAFQVWYEAMKVDERLIRSPTEFMSAFGKLEGLTGRLALVLHVLESGDTVALSGDSMARAVAIVKKFIVPSLRFAYCDVGGLAEESQEYWVTAHVLQIANEGTCTLSEIRRSGRRQFEAMRPFEADQLIKDVMAELAARQWVAVTDETRGNTTWQINPTLIDIFKVQRDRIIQIKQSVKDSIAGKHESMGNKVDRSEPKWRVRGVA
jgi:hypothetical protein